MTDEIMKDAELDEVVGGSGVECMGLLARLSSEGLYTPKTPLVIGNEKAAAQELQAYFNEMNIPNLSVELHSDDTPNSYGMRDPYLIIRCNPVYHSISEDEVISLIKKNRGIC